MQRTKLLPPPRWGDHGAVNRHLTAGGTVEGIVRDNPYREYYLSLHKKNMEQIEGPTKVLTLDEIKDLYAKGTPPNWLKDENGKWHHYVSRDGKLYVDGKENPCGKPHNNGEDTCQECEVIKKGV